MKFEFIINLKAAKQIGLKIPQWTLVKTDKVIKSEKGRINGSSDLVKASENQD